MGETIYPLAALEDSVEAHFSRFSTRGRGLYLFLVALVAAGIAALPLIRVDISVHAAGILRPAMEKHAVRAGAAGVVARVLIDRGQRVEAGDILISLREDDLRERGAAVADELASARTRLRDLDRLTAGASPESMEGAAGREESRELRQALRELGIRQARVAEQHEILRYLTERELESRDRLRAIESERARLDAEAALLEQTRHTRWEVERTGLTARLAQLLADSVAIAAERSRRLVRAPVSGTVEELAAVSPGSHVQPSDDLAVLSPDAGLHGEVFVPPRSIGLLRPGVPVRLSVDAFPYTEWGFVAGEVKDISQDFVLVDGRPVFRVRASLANDRLRLPTGVEGALMKGMTFRAHFRVARRSLFQLLHDDVNDWLNPVRG